jgi:hypothetical protein
MEGALGLARATDEYFNHVIWINDIASERLAQMVEIKWSTHRAHDSLTSLQGMSLINLCLAIGVYMKSGA